MDEAFAGDEVEVEAEADAYTEDPGLLVRADGHTRRNHGKIDINRLSEGTKMDLKMLMLDFRDEPGILKAQITFDFEPDTPPTVHVITEPTQEAIDRWLT